MPNEPLIVFRESCNWTFGLDAEVCEADSLAREAALTVGAINTLRADFHSKNGYACSASATEESVTGQATVTGTVRVTKPTAEATTDIAAACSLKRIAEGTRWAGSWV
jgi:hypothetical protein